MAQVTVSHAVHISGTTAEVTDALVTDATKVEVTDATVTIDDIPTISELNAIADETDGVVTATLAAASLSSLGELTTASTDDITITVNDAAKAAVSATDLSALGGKTDGTVTVSYAVHISGTPAEVTDALVTDATKVEVTDATVTITGAVNPTISELNAIADETDGVVTATLAAASLSSLGELTTESTDDITITVNDAAGDPVSATDLSTLGGKTSGVVTVENAVHITGDHEEVTAALVTSDSLVVADTALVTITDADNTAIDATELTTIRAKTSV